MGMELLREMPVIRRAREFHLYDNAGKRLLDLYLNGGKALLGHRPEGFSLIVKNTLARGVTAEYPSHEEGKMLKAAKALWGKTHPRIRYYRDMTRLGIWLSDQNLLLPGNPVPDPVLNETGEVSLWRPWLTGLKAPGIFIPVLPVPGMETGVLLCASEGIKDLPEGDIPSPVLAAGLSRCLWLLKSVMEEHPLSPHDSMSGLPVFKGWERKGSYLVWLGKKDDYADIFRRALEGGILLPPDPSIPAVLPYELTSGDRKVLNKLFSQGE